MIKSGDLKIYAQLAVLGLGAYLLYKLYNSVSGVVGGAVEVVKDVAAAAGDVVTGANAANLRAILDEALRKKGVEPSEYLLMFPQPKAGQKLPVGSWVVKYQSKSYYFVKKGAMPIYSL